MMQVKITQSLLFLQLRNAICIAFFLGLVTACVQVGRDFYKVRQEIPTTVQQIITIQQEAASQAVWAFDNSLAQQVVNGLFSYHPFYEIHLTDNSGSTIAHKKRPRKKGGLEWLAHYVVEDQTYSAALFVTDHPVSIGTLTVYIDKYLVAENFLDRTIINVLGSTLPLLVLVFTLIILLYQSLIKPLFRLTNQLTNIDPWHPDKAPLVIPSRHQHDELGLLVTTTNNLLEKYNHTLRQQQKAEHELKQAEEKFRSIFENAVEGIYQATVDGQFITANPAIAKFYGYDSPEHLIAEVNDIGNQLFLLPAKRQEFMDRLKSRGQVSSFEAQFKRRDGSAVWGMLNARLVCNSNNEILFVEGMMTDITSSKRAGENLAKIEAQLLQAQKMEALGNLAGGGRP